MTRILSFSGESNRRELVLSQNDTENPDYWSHMAVNMVSHALGSRALTPIFSELAELRTNEACELFQQASQATGMTVEAILAQLQDPNIGKVEFLNSPTYHIRHFISASALAAVHLPAKILLNYASAPKRNIN